MAISQPASDDALNSPGHSLQHRQIAADASAPVQTLTVDAAGRVCNTFIVEPNGTLTTIDAAMNLCSPGDTVLVAEGTYTETVTFDDDNITLRALGSAENTIITQAAATVVNMNTREGCTLEGFTISLTANDSNTKYPLFGNSDTSNNTVNTIRNCIITAASSAAVAGQAFNFTNGDYIFYNCRVSSTNSAAGPGAAVAIITNCPGVDVLRFYNCDFVCNFNINNATTYLFYVTTASHIMSVIGCTLTGTSATTGTDDVFYLTGAGSVNYFIGNTIKFTNSSTGATNLFIVPGGTCYIIANNLNSTNSDGDAKWMSNASTVYAIGNTISGDCASTAGTGFYFGNLIKTDMVYGSSDDPATSGVDRMANGFCIGADALNSVIDDATHGNGVTTIYIGDASIDATFTGAHYYELGDADLVTGELVSLKEVIVGLDTSYKIFRTITAKDPDAIGIYWGVTNDRDSMGKTGITAYSVAALGDSYDKHDRWPLNGAYVTKDAGNIKVGDLLCASSRHGYLEKQADDIVHSYTVAKAMQDINTDTQTAYIYFL